MGGQAGFLRLTCGVIALLISISTDLWNVQDKHEFWMKTNKADFYNMDEVLKDCFIFIKTIQNIWNLEQVSVQTVLTQTPWYLWNFPCTALWAELTGWSEPGFFPVLGKAAGYRAPALGGQTQLADKPIFNGNIWLSIHPKTRPEFLNTLASQKDVWYTSLWAWHSSSYATIASVTLSM